MITNLDILLPDEISEMRDLFHKWQDARINERYAEAKDLRDRFYWFDMNLGIDGVWYPIFEYSLNRQRRAFKRMEKYNVDIYPWERS